MGQLVDSCYGEPNAIANAIDDREFFNRSHDAVIRVYGRPARKAYDMGRKLSNGFMDLLKVVEMA